MTRIALPGTLRLFIFAFGLGACSSSVDERLADDSRDPVSDDSFQSPNCPDACTQDTCSIVTIADDIYYPRHLSVEGTTLYWATDGVHSWSMVDGGGPRKLSTDEPLAYAVNSNSVFWTDSEHLKRLDLVTGEVETLEVQAGGRQEVVLGVAADEDHVYYQVYDQDGLASVFARQDVAGGETTTLLGDSGRTRIALDETSAYVADCSHQGGALTRVDKATAAVETLHGEIYCDLHGLAIDAHHVYFVSPLKPFGDIERRLHLQRVAIGGGPVEVLGRADSATPVMDECFVYFAQFGDIVRVPKASAPGAVPEVVVPQAITDELEMIDNALFWTTPNSVRMLRKP